MTPNTIVSSSGRLVWFLGVDGWLPVILDPRSGQAMPLSWDSLEPAPAPGEPQDTNGDLIPLLKRPTLICLLRALAAFPDVPRST